MTILNRLIGETFRDRRAKPATNEFLRWRIWRYAVVVALGIALTPEFGRVAFAQRGQPATREDGSGTKRGFMLFGDLKVDESQAPGEKPMILDLILYTKGMQAVARQRISPNGRYRFMDIFDGDYWLVLELEGTEVVRESVFIAKASVASDIRHDLNLEWRATAAAKSKTATVSAADAYDRKEPNKNRFEKAQEAFDKKDYETAAGLFSQIVADDPQDFQASSELGTVYFAQKNLASAEKAYQRAIEIRPTFFLALLNLGRLRLLQKNFDGAIEALAQAVVVQPKSADANYFLGEAYLQILNGEERSGHGLMVTACRGREFAREGAHALHSALPTGPD